MKHLKILKGANAKFVHVNQTKAYYYHQKSSYATPNCPWRKKQIIQDKIV